MQKLLKLAKKLRKKAHFSENLILDFTRPTPFTIFYGHAVASTQQFLG